jgi:hypothetical protein
MLKRKVVSSILALAICLVSGCSGRNVIVQSGADSGEQFKQPVTERGTGEKSKWEVELKDGLKIKGYAEEIRNDGFTLVNWKTDEQYEVRFDEITSLREVHVLPTAANIAILACIGAFVVFAIWGLTSAGG